MEAPKLAALRSLLHGMERELGLDDLSQSQRDVYYAASLLHGAGEPITTELLQTHPLTRDIPRPTFFRSLKSLLDRTLMFRSGGERSGRYVLSQD